MKREKWTAERHAKVQAAWERRKNEISAVESLNSNEKKKGRKKWCFYCGEHARGCKDRIPPQSERKRLPSNTKIKFFIVPACRECVLLLRHDCSLTIEERKTNLEIKLREKYGRLLLTKEWPSEILGTVGFRLRDSIEHITKAKIRLEKRINHLRTI